MDAAANKGGFQLGGMFYSDKTDGKLSGFTHALPGEGVISMMVCMPDDAFQHVARKRKLVHTAKASQEAYSDDGSFIRER